MFHRPKAEEPVKEQKVEARPAEKQVKQPQSQQYVPVQKQEYVPQPEQKTITQAPVKEEKIMSTNLSDNQETAERHVETSASVPFQRPPQMQRTVPGSFGGYAHAPAHSGGMYDTRGNSDDRRLVIGKGITMSGEIEACDYLLVEGTLEAALKGAKVLEVAESGVFYGAVEIEEATIAGRFEGELTVNGRITVKSGGSVTGAIAYKELAVEAGATVDGKLSPLVSSAAQAAQPAKKTMAPKNDNSGQQQSSELPFAGTAAEAAE